MFMRTKVSKTPERNSGNYALNIEDDDDDDKVIIIVMMMITITIMIMVLVMIVIVIVTITKFSIVILHVPICHLRTFAPIVSAHPYCASHVSIARASSRGPREEKCHAKVCKQIWRPRRKVKKEVKLGDS